MIRAVINKFSKVMLVLLEVLRLVLSYVILEVLVLTFELIVKSFQVSNMTIGEELNEVLLTVKVHSTTIPFSSW